MLIVYHGTPTPSPGVDKNNGLRHPHHTVRNALRSIRLELFFTLLIVFVTSLAVRSQPAPASRAYEYQPADQEEKEPPVKAPAIVRITGVRFAYPLIQQWIDRFNKQYPDVQVIIEPRGSTDPLHYDILVEAIDLPEAIQHQRTIVNVARYAVLPVANIHAAFSRRYAEKGLDRDLIVQLFFHDVFADKENERLIKEPFTVYTRLQKAGAPTVFANYFGYTQKDFKGKAIAGADEHVLKVVRRDTLALSCLPMPLIFDRDTKRLVEGIAVLPVDLNGNGRVNETEKFYDELPTVTEHLEGLSPHSIQNIPISYLHLSVSESAASTEAITFLRWVIDHGEQDLHDYGYLRPEPGRLDKVAFEQFASRHR